MRLGLLQMTTLAAAIYVYIYPVALHADRDSVNDLIVKVGAAQHQFTAEPNGQSTRTRSQMGYEGGFGYRYSDDGEIFADAGGGKIKNVSIFYWNVGLKHFFLSAESSIRPFVGLSLGKFTTTLDGQSGSSSVAFKPELGATIETPRSSIGSFILGVKAQTFISGKSATHNVNFKNFHSGVVFVAYRF
ncbi:MAG: hypothetical protein LBN32_03630 [Helicobacteraceae bacterium]|jgi:hypothetical protein|nr:hypothetical protein [Helicobacteraceae bacterium]